MGPLRINLDCRGNEKSCLRRTIAVTSMQHWDFASNLSEASRSNLTVMFLCRKLVVVVAVVVVGGGGVLGQKTWMEQEGEESRNSFSITIMELPWRTKQALVHPRWHLEKIHLSFLRWPALAI